MLFRQPRDPQDMKLLKVPWVQIPPEGLGARGHSREVSASAVREHLAPSACKNSSIRVPIFLSASERAHPGCPKEMGCPLPCFMGGCDVFPLRKSWYQKCWTQTKVWLSFLAPFGSVSLFSSTQRLGNFVNKLRWKILTDSFSNSQEIICAIKSYFDIIKSKIKWNNKIILRYLKPGRMYSKDTNNNSIWVSK